MARADCPLDPAAVCDGESCGGETRPTGHIAYNGDADTYQYCGADGQWYALRLYEPGGQCADDSAVTCILNAARANGDPDFTAGNIADGVNVLGVMGTFTGGGGCTAPASCTGVGDVCSDGSIFAGFVVYNNTSCEPLYVTDNNQSTSSQWKNATGTNDITDPDDHVDGRYNRDNRGSGTFPAFELCEDNTYHGKSDWYLPARDELHLLWKNRTAINANAAGNFTTGTYWSSTEYNTDFAWYQPFGVGGQNNIFKTVNYGVRCVRRD